MDALDITQLDHFNIGDRVLSGKLAVGRECGCLSDSVSDHSRERQSPPTTAPWQDVLRVFSARSGLLKKCAKAAIVSLEAYVYASCIAAPLFTLAYYCLLMRTNTDQLQLFGRAHLSDALRNHTSQISQRVQAIAESVLRARSDEEIVSELTEELKIVPLEIFRDCATMTREEIQLDVSGDPRRDIFPSGRKVLIPGVKVVVSIPYRGDKELWYLQPNSFQCSSPRGTIHATPNSDEGILAIALKQPADEPLEQIKTMLDSRIRDI